MNGQLNKGECGDDSEIGRSYAKTSISRILYGSNKRILSQMELKDIYASITTIWKWDNIKNRNFFIASRKCNEPI